MTSKFPIPIGYDAKRKVFRTYTEDRHLCTIAPTRSGKGATVIAQALMQVPHSVVCIDPKGQNAAITARARRQLGQEVFVCNPQHMHPGEPWRLPRHRFNPLAKLNINSPHVVADVAAIAQALIVTQGREPYFDETARNLVKAVILFFVSTLGKKATLRHLRKALTDIAARNLDAAELFVAMMKSEYDFIRQPIGRFLDPEQRDISSAINTAITQTEFLDDPAFSDPVHGVFTGNDFSFAQLKKKPTTVYLVMPGHLMTPYSRFLRLMITAALDAVTSEPGGHPVLFILDEFARLENFPAVTSAFGFAAGFNVQLWPFLQDLAQLEEVYGKGGMSILANSGMTQFFCCTELTTAEYLQRRGGQRTGESRSRTWSGKVFRSQRSETRGENREPLLPVEKTMSLPDDQSIAFFAGMHDPSFEGRTPYWKIPRLAGLYDPDPYHVDEG